MNHRGWIPFSQRTAAMRRAHDAAFAAMPAFAIKGKSEAKGDKILLTDFWKHPEVVGSVGFEFPGIHQETGSCVGAGGGDVVFTLSAVEVVRLGDPEQALVPFWLLPYGKSRERGGMSGQGEGSMGSTFAEAIRLDGIIPATLDGLPKFTKDSNGLTWGSKAEMTWSDGARIGEEWLVQSRKHLVRTTSPCSSPADVRAAIQNYYPCTAACGKYVNSGTAKVTGTPPVLLGRLNASGGHQIGLLGWCDHPELGDLFYYMNQWPKPTYSPADPAGGPLGGCWIPAADVDFMCRDEVYAFSQFDGFPGQAKLMHHYF